MNKIKAMLFATMLLFASCSSNKGTKIYVEDIESCCNTMSFFRGIEPDLCYRDLCDIVGEPNEYKDFKRGEDEKCHNPIYYFDEGKVMCYWSGGIRDEIGVVEYTPYNNTHIQIDSFFTCPLDSYGITSETTKVCVYESDVLYFVIELKNYEIVGISYIKYKKK